MNEEPNPLPSRDEARETLAAIDATRAETRRNIAGSEFGPNMIWGGLLWMAVFMYAQFLPGPGYLLWMIAAAFLVARVVMKKFRRPLVKEAPNLKVAALALAIMVYAGIFWALLGAQGSQKNLSGADIVAGARKCSAYILIVAMFFNVIIGLTARPSRFFVGWGLLMTALILVGYYCVPEWYNLWLGVVGGGTFILSGIFIRKFWE